MLKLIEIPDPRLEETLAQAKAFLAKDELEFAAKTQHTRALIARLELNRKYKWVPA